jgi:hypothetical protein
MKTANENKIVEQGTNSVMTPIAAGKDRIKWMVSRIARRPDFGPAMYPDRRSK